MIDAQDVGSLIGAELVGSNGEAIGTIDEIYLDDDTRRPEWATLDLGLPGGSATFVPLELAEATGDVVRVAFTAEQVRNAPQVDDGAGHIDALAEDELYQYYDGVKLGGGDIAPTSVDVPPAATTAETSTAIPNTGPSEYASSGGVAETDPDSDVAMTRSEERMRVGRRSVVTGKARLRRFVVTEQETITVPVRKEKVVLETVQVNEAGEEIGTPQISEEFGEVTVSEERVIVSKETVPLERVRIAKEVEHSEQTVTAELRKEQIEVEVDGDVEIDETRRP